MAKDNVNAQLPENHISHGDYGLFSESLMKIGRSCRPVSLAPLLNFIDKAAYTSRGVDVILQMAIHADAERLALSDDNEAQPHLSEYDKESLLHLAREAISSISGDAERLAEWTKKRIEEA